MLCALIVDDDPDILDMMCEVLTSNNYSPVAISNGCGALSLLEKVPIHIIITDIRMPDMDGFAFTSEVRQRGYQQPIIGLTGLIDKGEKILHANDGTIRTEMDLILKKPFVYEEFYQSLGQLSDKINYRII